MNGFLIVLGFLAAAALAVAVFVFGTWVVVWNVNDIAAVGANFWNVFWILLVGTVFFGGASKATS